MRRDIIAVTDEYAFLVNFPALARKLLSEGDVVLAHLPGLGKPARGICKSVQELRARPAAALPGKIHVEYRRCPVRKRQLHGRAAEEHHADFFTRSDKRVDEGELIFGQAHVFPVAALAFRIIGKPREDEYLLRALRLFDRLRDKFGICFKRIFLISAHELIARAHLVECVLDRAEFGGIYQRAARALIAHFLEKISRDQHGLFIVERQHALVFHQDGAVFRYLARKLIVRIEICVLSLRAGIFVHDFQNVLHRPVQDRSFERAVFERVEYAPAADGGVARHFQIESRLQRGHPVLHGAPIGHHKPVKAPFSAQHIRQKPLVFAAICSVYPVVSAHDRRGLSLFHGYLEGLEIYLAHRPLVGDGIAHEAVIFTVVEREMFERYAHARALHPFYLGGGTLSREQRIFGIIFEISARARIALDIRAGTQDYPYPVMPRLFSDRLADLARVLLAPTASDRCRRGKRRRGIAPRHAVVGVFSLNAQSVRTVRHTQRRYPKPRHRVGIHKIRSRDQRRFFFFREFR